MVAGKNSDQTATKLGTMLSRCVRDDELPFDWLRANEHSVHNVLVANRIGQYTRIERAIRESVNLDLRNASIKELESVYGVGPKTARFFVLHTRKNIRCAVLDTHILKWLKGKMPNISIPSSTPSGEKYDSLERMFLVFANAEFPGLSVAEIDLLIWSKQSGRME